MTDSAARLPDFLSDPRGRGFRTRSSVEEVVALIDTRVRLLGTEAVELAKAAGRVLARDVVAAGPIPPFDRAAMDGYALRGEETFGADAYTPAVFRVIGRSRPGRGFEGLVTPGSAVEIATGAPIPAGADAVVPVEQTASTGDRLLVVEPNPPGRHVGRRGEDVSVGTRVFECGRALRPQDLGVLSALGFSEVEVQRCPHAVILTTGDELLPAGSPVASCQIADMNSVMLEALIRRDGGMPTTVGPLPDDRDLLLKRLEHAASAADLVLVSGGSSTGTEDHAPELLASLGTLEIHGVALRPASPTGLGFIGRVPVVLLPGNPVSCLCAYDLFAGRIVRLLGGRNPAWPYRPIDRGLAQKLSSTIGRLDYARVRIVDDQVEPISVSGASILSTTTRADGFVLIPADLEGYPAGAQVTVWLYDP
jgi:molybdopterin molybdotransferase